MFKIIEEENIVIKNFLFRCHLSMEITEALCGSDIMSVQNSLSLQDSVRQFLPFQQMSVFETLNSNKYVYPESVFLSW